MNERHRITRRSEALYKLLEEIRVKTKLLIIGISAALVLTLTSCQELLDLIMGGGVTVEERVNQFELMLNNANRTVDDFKSHLHPTEMQNYAQIDEDTIETGPLRTANADFIIGEPNFVGDIATCTFENVNGATGTLELQMAEDGSDYKIKKITLTLDSAPNDPQVLLMVLRGQ